jgi:single-strand DNA-binding protein
MNRVTLIGFVGADPEIRAAGSGNKVANFNLATSKRWKDKQTGEQKEKTEWHRIICWGDGLVDVIGRYVRKGSQLLVEGELQTRKWTDKQNIERYSTEIVVQGFDGQVRLLDRDNSTRPPAPQQPPQGANLGGSSDQHASNMVPASAPSDGPPEWHSQVNSEIPF